MTIPFAMSFLRLVTGCAFVLTISGGAAYAHGHGHNGNHNDHNGQHISSHGGDWGGDHGWLHKPRRHHRKSAGFGPGGLGPVHGPGSSHNPIVTQPPKITKPIVTVGPAKPSPSPNVCDHGGPHYVTKHFPDGGSCTYDACYFSGCDEPLGSVVHDHRNGKDCSYTQGDYDSWQQYLMCEGR